MCLAFRALKGADDLLSNRLETERRVIDLPVNVRLLPEDHQAAPCLKRPNYHLARAPRREIISHRLFPSSVSPTYTFLSSDPQPPVENHVKKFELTHKYRLSSVEVL